MMQRERVGEALAGDVGRRAVDGLEDRRVVADVGAGHDAQAADQAGAQVADDVAVEVLHQQHVEARRVLHQLHAAGVDDHLVVLDVGILLLVDLRGRSWRNRPSVSFMMLALWKTVTFLRLRGAWRSGRRSARCACRPSRWRP